jgi:ADP-ribosylglycohydrolase
MRVLPLALWHRGTDAELVALAARQSLPTHGHPRSQAACAFYCLWARSLLEGSEDGWRHAVARMAQPGTSDAIDRAELAFVLDEGHRATAAGTGYVVDTLWSARLALERGATYEACVREAIRFGYDTDTTAAVAGGLAGIVHGIDGIPPRWRDALRGKELVDPLVEKLVDRHALGPA